MTKSIESTTTVEYVWSNLYLIAVHNVGDARYVLKLYRKPKGGPSVDPLFISNPSIVVEGTRNHVTDLVKIISKTEE